MVQFSVIKWGEIAFFLSYPYQCQISQKVHERDTKFLLLFEADEIAEIRS